MKTPQRLKKLSERTVPLVIVGLLVVAIIVSVVVMAKIATLKGTWWLPLAFLGTAAILAVIAAVFAFGERKPANTKLAKEPKPSTAAKRWRWLPATVIIAILGFGTWWYFRRGKPGTVPTTHVVRTPTIAALPNCAGDEVRMNDQALERTLPLRMTCWSPLINTPSYRDYRWHVTEELHGVKFWDGTVWDRETLLAYLNEQDGWMGQLRFSKFRLRGKGVVTVFLERS